MLRAAENNNSKGILGLQFLNVLKRIFLVILLLACAGFIAFVFWKFNKEKVKRGDPFAVVLSRAEVIMEIDAMQEAENFESLVEHPSFSFYINSDSLLLAPPIYFAFQLHKIGFPRALPEEIENDPVVFSWFGNDVCIAYGIEEAHAAQAVASCFPVLNFTSRNFHGTQIMEAGFQSNVRYTVLDDVLVISNASSLIEETILNYEKKIIPPALLQKAREVSATDVPLHVYCNLDNGEWLQLDAQFTETTTSLSGYALLNENPTHRFSLLDKKNENNSIIELPMQTSVFEIFSYNSFEEGWKKSEDFFANTDRSKFWGQAWKDFGDSCQCDLNEAMLSWRGNSWGSFLTDQDSSAKPVLFFSVRDSIDVLKLMQPLIPEYSIDDGPIAHFPYQQLWDRNNSASLLVTPNYIMQEENLVLVAEDIETLIGVLRSGEQPLTFNDSYSLRQQVCVVNPLPDLFMRMVHEMGFNQLSVSHFKENKYRVNFTGDTQNIDNSTAHSATAEVEEVELNDTDTTFIGHWEVKNHNTGEKEFLVQNSRFEIMLCEKSVKGKKLWKEKFPEAIFGEVIQVDGFKNGKLQMMFLTSRAIHCMDRTGNEVPGYPIILPSAVSSSLAVFDYDKKKNYRIIIGCENQKIYNYTIEPKPAEGWNPPAFNSSLSSMHHLQSGDDDFLVALLEDRSIHVLKRTGLKIFTVKQKLPENFQTLKVKMLPGNTIYSSSIILQGDGEQEVKLELKK